LTKCDILVVDMKKALLRLIQKQPAEFQVRKIGDIQEVNKSMQEQLVSMERFGQPLIVAFK